VIGAFRSSYCSVVPASSCSLSGPPLYRSPVVVFFDRGHPCFRNFNSSTPVDVIRVKSYDRAKLLVTKPSVITGEKKHLSSVLVSNGYPSSFVQKITKARTTPRREPVAEFTLCPRSFGVSPPLPRTKGIRTVFKSDMTLRSHLVRPKDTVNPAKRDGVA